MRTLQERPSVRTNELVQAPDVSGADRLRRRARAMQERSIDLREWSADQPGPVRTAMRRRASELDLNAAALALAADGFEASGAGRLAATG